MNHRNAVGADFSNGVFYYGFDFAISALIKDLI